MPLIKYGQFLTYPDGTPAADTTFPVQLLGGNVLVPVFADKAGTTPMTNPAPTDLDGLLTFYAAPGAFFTEVAGALFHYVVDALEPDDAWPGTFVHEQTTPSATWTVEHHFGVEPVVDSLVLSVPTAAEVAHPDAETTVITFSTPASGVAMLRR